MIELITALSVSATIEQGADAAVESGLTSAKDIFAGYYKEKGFKAKDITDAYKAAEERAGKARIRVGGFAQDYYDWLAEERRTEFEARNYILDEKNSKNVKAHLTHYLNIWALTESVRTGQKTTRSFGAEKEAEQGPSAGLGGDKWEYNAAEPFADVRSARETLKRETAKARPNRNNIHPDKVAKFKDHELTDLFTKAFQQYGERKQRA